MNMKNKHCELDIIPTSTVKQILDDCLPTITRIVNLSLTTGEFCEEWKTATARPYFKTWPEPDKQELHTNIKPTLHLQSCKKMHAQTTTESLQKIMTYYQIFNQPIMNTIVQRQASSSSPTTYLVSEMTWDDSNCKSGFISSL